MVSLRLLRTRGLPIFWQLQIEEALLRASADNWCLLNDGCSSPAIVMGISGKPTELVHEDAAKTASIQVIKRFTGGGTVVVDDQTIFATFIIHAHALPKVECYPRPIMQWSSEFYDPIFRPYGNFLLQTQDYAFGHQKFGGNAQAITKQRWVHHTSFLWDFQPERMKLLKHPLKVPEYRAGRHHLDFICRLKDFMADREAFLQAIPQRLTELGFELEEADLTEAEEYMSKQYLRSTKLIELA